jgi:hypothetical protein
MAECGELSCLYYIVPLGSKLGFKEGGRKGVSTSTCIIIQCIDWDIQCFLLFEYYIYIYIHVCKW